MTFKITRPFVEKQLESLNNLMGMPLKPYLNNGDGKGIVPQAGNFHLDSAYGKWQFCRMSPTEGCSGAGPVVSHGYVSLREVSNQISAYVCGIKDERFYRKA